MKRILVICFTLFLVACGAEIESNMSNEVNDFSFKTQDNETLSLEELKGEWWVADFIFTNCTTVCLPMTSNMSKLQDKMEEENLDAQLVSFSVDPEFDTPEVLKEYAESYQADLSNWTFTTGYDFQTIKEFSVKSFKSALEKPLEGDDQVMHGTSFFLVNPEGEVIKRYSGVESKAMDDIIKDLELVL
ncbi:cytochrome c oxidase assembly protein [Virgibacillus profundi]|uniref:Cytochrome c oxidase assembly protein n=1 Tax=Virgibacillus profundi TaxID=2024555 RepID=A0A2A2ICB3_9BACI|nr:SCO family protein [Virgibacillus profundi]PAV29651.1 cytochrome c oxidase assembly protein [Virgibacillus profundi]PXY53823.1 SCO family protein [Virgibacillus profundi]